MTNTSLQIGAAKALLALSGDLLTSNAFRNVFRILDYASKAYKAVQISKKLADHCRPRT